MKNPFGSDIKPIVKKSTNVSKYRKDQDFNYLEIDNSTTRKLIYSIELLAQQCKSVLIERRELIIDHGVMDIRTRTFTSKNAPYLRCLHDELLHAALRLGESLKVMEIYGIDPNEEIDSYPQ